jgi:hypothetical protein
LKVIKEWPYREMSIASAVEEALDGSDDRRGELETLQASARLNGEVLGRLVEVLAKTGILSPRTSSTFSAIPIRSSIN